MDVFTQCDAIYTPVMTDGSYHTQVDMGKQHFSGLIVCKTLHDTIRHAVFMTETGFKYFDLEFSPHGFNKTYIIESLDRTPITRTLQRDLSLLLFAPVTTQARVEIPDPIKTVLSLPQQHGGCIYTADKKCDALERIIVGQAAHPDVTISVSSATASSEQSITITHKHNPLHIDMKRLVKID
jgi:hypothetical protein